MFVLAVYVYVCAGELVVGMDHRQSRSSRAACHKYDALFSGLRLFVFGLQGSI